MKKLLTTAFFIATLLDTQAQKPVPGPEKDAHAGHSHATTQASRPTLDGTLSMKETEFDFGTIPQGKPVYHLFEVSNAGSTPVQIENVQTTCGCTTPEWSKEPIASGKSSQIKVGFNAASEGPFEKYITILYNSGLSKQVKIKGIVWKAPPSPAPANASLQFLKQQIQ